MNGVSVRKDARVHAKVTSLYERGESGSFSAYGGGYETSISLRMLGVSVYVNEELIARISIEAKRDYEIPSLNQTVNTFVRSLLWWKPKGK